MSTANQLVMNNSGRMNPLVKRYTEEERIQVVDIGLKPEEIRHPNKAYY